MSNQADDTVQNYAVRFTTGADREAIIALLRFDEMEGPAIARIWYLGLRAAAEALSEQPYSNPIMQRESRLTGRQTRRLLYRRTRESVAYYAFYTVEETGADGPTVVIFHIRHAARRPLTRKEAKEVSAPD